MNNLKPMTIALLAGCGISAGAAYAAGCMDALP